MACDLCGKVTADTVGLMPSLATPKMAAVCRECETRLNKRLGQLRSRAINAAWRKLRIEMGVEAARGPRPWWRRLFS